MSRALGSAAQRAAAPAMGSAPQIRVMPGSMFQKRACACACAQTPAHATSASGAPAAAAARSAAAPLRLARDSGNGVGFEVVERRQRRARGRDPVAVVGEPAANVCLTFGADFAARHGDRGPMRKGLGRAEQCEGFGHVHHQPGERGFAGDGMIRDCRRGRAGAHAAPAAVSRTCT
jgi:hypothetical protein